MELVRRARAALIAVALVATGLAAAPADRAEAIGHSAVRVIGQNGSFTGAPGGSAANQLSNARGVAVDATRHRMFIADRSNNRVRVYNLDANNAIADDVADFVLGQTGFGLTTSGRTISTFDQPVSVAYDDARQLLYVADSANRRVLVFDTATVTNGLSALYVLGQADFTTSSTAVTATNLAYPGEVALSKNNKYLLVADVSNNRVMAWDTATLSNGAAVAFVLGQTNATSATYAGSPTAFMTQYPQSVAIDKATNKAYVMESGGHRIVVFDLASPITGMSAIQVLGQVSLTGSGTRARSRTSIDGNGGLAVGGGRLFVADRYAHRLVVFDTTNTTNDAPAVAVIGQPDFSQGTPDNGGRSASSLAYVWGVSYDSSRSRLFVADSGRVLVFDAVVSMGQVAVAVDPSLAFTVACASAACNGESGFMSSAGSPTSVALGRTNGTGSVSGGQVLSGSTNASSGFAVHVSGSALANANYTFPSVGAGGSASALSGPAFALTYRDSSVGTTLTSPSAATFVPLNATPNAILRIGAPGSGMSCVSFAVASTGAVPAGTYTTTARYTAVPLF